jgi:hypothetical protein
MPPKKVPLKTDAQKRLLALRGPVLLPQVGALPKHPGALALALAPDLRAQETDAQKRCSGSWS